MIKKLYKQEGWTATSAIVRDNRVEARLTIDHRYNFCCPKCRCLLRIHRIREISVRDLPLADKDVELCVDTIQGYCISCQRFHTLRPDLCHPALGCTWRLMRQLSRFLVHAPARFLEAEYSLPYTPILHMDKEILAHDIPKPKLDRVEGILIDEKYPGASKGFATLVVNAATGEPLEMAPGRDAHGLAPFFNKPRDSQKKAIRYLGIDQANAYKAAASRHLPHTKVCYDAYHLVSNMNGTLESIRRSTMQHPSYSLWQLMKGKRYVLLRGREKIDGDAKETLRKLSHLNRKPYIAYLLKEQFRQVFQTKDGNTATLCLILWIRMCMESKVKQLDAFAWGISSKFNGVAMGSVTG